MKFDGDTICRLLEVAKNTRVSQEPEWRDAARFCLPQNYGAWQTSGALPLGTATQISGVQDARRTNYESEPIRAVRIYSTVLDRMTTPVSSRWHGLKAGGPAGPKLMRIKRVAEYFDVLTDLIFSLRYHPRANFRTAQYQTYVQLGVFGTGPKFISNRNKKLPNNGSGLLYRSCNLRDTYLMYDEEGNLDTVMRVMFPTARIARQMFGDDKLPADIKLELDRPDQTKTFEVVHCVAPRDDFDFTVLDSRRYPYGSAYVYVQRKEMIGEPGGYSSMPYTGARVNPDDGPYGYSPAAEALASIRSANAVKKSMIRTGQHAAEPRLLAHDDGVISGSMSGRPNSVIYGGVDSAGRKLVVPLESGDFSIGKDLLLDERNVIRSSFFVDLFQILIETPQMTATQVVDRIQERAALIAPTMAMLQHEDLGPTVERELAVIRELGMLPEMPPELKEAGSEYEVTYTSPLALAQEAEKMQGFMQTVDFAANIVKLTGDPAPMRVFAFNRAVPEIAAMRAVPARWLNDEEELAAQQDEADTANQVDQLSKAAPAIAGVVKATQGAATDKST